MKDPESIFNHDVLLIVDMIDRFLKEVGFSQSSGVSGMIAHDAARMKSYTQSLRTLHGWITSQPLLDLPETHPREYPLEAKPDIPNRESESVNMLVRLLEALRIELIHSQSARYSSTLISHDSKRFLDIVTKIELFISEYVETQTPLDLPESSPEEPQTGPGLTGV